MKCGIKCLQSICNDAVAVSDRYQVIPGLCFPCMFTLTSLFCLQLQKQCYKIALLAFRLIQSAYTVIYCHITNQSQITKHWKIFCNTEEKSNVCTMSKSVYPNPEFKFFPKYICPSIQVACSHTVQMSVLISPDAVDGHITVTLP